MEKLERKRILQETALLHYKGWREGMERHSREPLFQMLGLKAAATLHSDNSRY